MVPIRLNTPQGLGTYQSYSGVKEVDFMVSPVGTVIDMQTGEVINHIYHGDKLVRKKTSDYLERTAEINKEEPYIKVYTKPISEVAKRIDGGSLQLLYVLLKYISYEDGILQYSNGSLLSKNAIITETGLTKNTVTKHLNILIKEQIIGRHRTGRRNCYTINPYIFMKGKRVNKTLKKLFEGSRWSKNG